MAMRPARLIVGIAFALVACTNAESGTEPAAPIHGRLNRSLAGWWSGESDGLLFVVILGDAGCDVYCSGSSGSFKYTVAPAPNQVDHQGGVAYEWMGDSTSYAPTPTDTVLVSLTDIDRGIFIRMRLSLVDYYTLSGELFCDSAPFVCRNSTVVFRRP